MADPTPDKPVNELKVLLVGTDGKTVIKDKSGNDRHLPPLTLLDMVEFEKRMGTAFGDSDRLLKLSDMVFVLYLSLRKDGRTPEQIRKRDFVLTEADVADMFDCRYLSKYSTIFAEMLKLSGLELPQEPSPAKG